jgi:hypothetical protein
VCRGDLRLDENLHLDDGGSFYPTNGVLERKDVNHGQGRNGHRCVPRARTLGRQTVDGDREPRDGDLSAGDGGDASPDGGQAKRRNEK